MHRAEPQYLSGLLASQGQRCMSSFLNIIIFAFIILSTLRASKSNLFVIEFIFSFIFLFCKFQIYLQSPVQHCSLSSYAVNSFPHSRHLFFTPVISKSFLFINVWFLFFFYFDNFVIFTVR